MIFYIAHSYQLYPHGPMSTEREEAKVSGDSPKLLKRAGAQKFKEQQIFSSEKATDLAVCRCSGVLRGDGVVIASKQDIAALVQLGSYGKGVFSRSIPCHNVAPSLSLPQRRERGKAGSVTSSDMPAGLTRDEQELAKKMQNFEECQERRIALHSEWRKEAQLAVKLEGCPQAAAFKEDHAPHPVDCSGGSTALEGKDRTEGVLSFREQLRLFKTKLELQEKHDPYKMDEYLQLLSEEAFYLSYDLQLLNVVTHDTKKLLHTQELWSQFSKTPNFPPRYAVYRYYRRKGWVPKSGIKFGVDFVLYKKGPVEYHSSYAVVVRSFTESEVQELSQNGVSRCGKTLTWRDVVAMDRVCKSVVKDLILCHVIVGGRVEQPSTWSSFPDCLENVRIAEVLVHRWDPDKDR